jgi:hypothetical protein
MRCIHTTKQGNKKVSTWKEPTYTPLPKKKLRLFGFKNKVDGLPHCPKGWILRDFDMGDWIKIKCFKKVIQKKKVCIKNKVLTRRVYPQVSGGFEGGKTPRKPLSLTLIKNKNSYRVPRLANK